MRKISRLRTILRTEEISMKKLSVETGISMGTVVAYCKKDDPSMPSVNNAILIAKYLGYYVEEIWSVEK